MISIQLTTIGEVSFESSVRTSEGYRYDIPCDRFGIPCIPLGPILSEHGIDLKGLRVGFAHPEGYLGMAEEAGKLFSLSSEALNFIRRYFTNSTFLEKEKFSTRSLKAGQRYLASLYLPIEDSAEIRAKKEKTLKEALAKITHIGVSYGNISGEVSFSLVETEEFPMAAANLSELCSYSALDYSILLITPTCFHQPYADGPSTSLYIPGERINDLLRRVLGSGEAEEDGLICSNAYISDGRKRLLPVPACASLVKNDKTQLRYRVAPGRDPHRSEQPSGLSDRYTPDTESHLLVYTSPETERIRTRMGTMADALSAGQVFSGTIYASDKNLRRIAAFFLRRPVLTLGSFSEEGFGEVLISVDALREKRPPAHIMADCFDVTCLSDTLLLNDEGMPAVSAEDLLGEIEYLLNMGGELEIESKYTGIHKDYSENIRWKREGEIIRCIAKGAILRVRRKDRKSVDISPILHTFIGERQHEGWGEIRTLPAREGYYRLAEQAEPVLYAINSPVSFRQMSLKALMVNSIINDILKTRIRALANLDRDEYNNGASVAQLIPEEILMIYRDRLAPELPLETLYDWYEEGLKDDSI